MLGVQVPEVRATSYAVRHRPQCRQAAAAVSVRVANPLWGALRVHGELLKLWHRRRPDHGCKIHGQEKAATVAKLEDLPSQSRRRYRIDRPVRRPYDFVSAAVWTSGLAASPQEGRADSARRPEGRTRARLANLAWASPSVRSGLNIRQGYGWS